MGSDMINEYQKEVLFNIYEYHAILHKTVTEDEQVLVNEGYLYIDGDGYLEIDDKGNKYCEEHLND